MGDTASEQVGGAAEAAVGALAAGTETPFGPLAGGRLRVLTWNLWWRFGPWEERQPAIVETIRRLDPDIVCLQETWPEGVDDLAASLGYHSAYASRIDFDGVAFGNGVLARWPLAGHEVLPLPAPTELDEHRTCLRADVDHPDGPIQVFCTHLNWRFDHSEIRQDQVRAICRFVADSPGRRYPAVLCGDFNAEPDSDEIRMLTGKAAVPVPKVFFHDAWVVVHAGDEGAGDGGTRAGHTWANVNPYAKLDLEYDRRIDYVFAGWPKSGGVGHVLDCQVVAREPIDGVWPSDHFAVLATLRA
jgi:endonuclease/exonuclease/phosphatase family metal-dependent hydrolase